MSSFSIPLKPSDAEPIVPLQEVFTGVYDRARYAGRIDYRQPVPSPKLSPSDQQWVDQQLAVFRGAMGGKTE